MEPSDSQFAKQHLFLDNLCSSELVQSVFLADGIHCSLNDELKQNLPERFEKPGMKAKITWFGTLFLAGIGMFVQAYVIITTGQIKLIWHDQYPECWVPDEDAHCPDNIECCGLFPNTPSDNGTCSVDTANSNMCTSDGLYKDQYLCSSNLINSVSYSEFAGIMLGMVTFGAIADAIGRKTAGVLTALCMVIGITVITFSSSEDTSCLFLTISIFFGVYGLGVGGEFPLAASGAADHDARSKEDALDDDDSKKRKRVLLEAAKTTRRGETIALVFSMQSVGAVFGSFVLVCFLYFSQQTRVTCADPSSNSTGNDPKSLNAVWHGVYMIGFIFVLMLLLYRTLVLEGGDGHSKLLTRKKRREAKLGKNTSTWKILKFYAPRLMGTGGNWFVWDIAFYGLNLFSGPIINSIAPEGDLVMLNGWLLFNNICAMFGCFGAAVVIDHVGRKQLQMASYLLCAILFYLTASLFYTAPSGAIMFLYFASTFFDNFGANVTTYVMAAETYPTELRATCHGLSAFLGKTGALIATIIFGQLSTTDIFWVCGSVSIVGFLFTVFFSVDLTHVSLAEHDAQLELFLEGRLEEYKGKLNKPQHLSLFERAFGLHGEYHPDWARSLVTEEKTKSIHGVLSKHKFVSGTRVVGTPHKEAEEDLTSTEEEDPESISSSKH